MKEAASVALRSAGNFIHCLIQLAYKEQLSLSLQWLTLSIWLYRYQGDGQVSGSDSHQEKAFSSCTEVSRGEWGPDRREAVASQSALWAMLSSHLMAGQDGGVTFR